MDVLQVAIQMLAIAFLLLSTVMISPVSTALLSNATDKAALQHFKVGLSNSSQQILSSWNDSSHFCEWEGITCGRRHQRVTRLDLHGLGLEGPISSYLGNLSFLEGINLDYNNFHSNLPPQLGQLLRLQRLSISYNNIGGEIPANLSHCYKLRVLKLNYNKLVGEIHADLTTFPSLVVMNFTTNNLTGSIPPSTGNLSSLEYLSLSNNNLEGSIPSTLGKVKGLSNLGLALNSLSGTFPRSIYNVSSLIGLALTQNQLHGSLPSDLGELHPNLERVLLSYNRFSGSIPVSLSNASELLAFQIFGNSFIGIVPSNLGSLQKLKYLGLSGNKLENNGDLSFVTSLTNCSSLTWLDFDTNHFTGPLPESISNLSTQLTRLGLGSNQFYGKIPTGIGNLVGLEFLSVQNSYLTGVIPSGIGMLPRLQILVLSENKLSGVLPSTLCNASSMLEFNAAENELEGSIPASIGKCKRLLRLQLKKNKLHGNIPREIFFIMSLSVFLDLSDNSFTGSLPIEVSNLTNLGKLDASNNNLIGELPSALGSCQSLETLNLQNNLFNGLIPQSFSNIKNLRLVDLSQNNLSGEIPQFLENIRSLEYLNLSFNFFEGPVPSRGVFQKASAISVVGNKMLCGGPKYLNLSDCQVKVSGIKRSRTPHLVIPLICSSIFIVFLTFIGIAYYWKRKPNNEGLASSLFFNTEHLRISYEELRRATNEFSLENIIGLGRFGTVYKGRIEQERNGVAVKVLNLQLRGASKTFEAECEALRQVKHRNLVKLITSCSSIDREGNDFKALIYEFMANGSLETWLHMSYDRENPPKVLTIVQRLNIAVDVASALDYLHNHCHNPIVHCDLKPSNILLDDDLIAHLGDFGLAKILNEILSNFSREGSSSMAIEGTIGYVPPEYGVGGEVSTCGDVYSFGIILLEMFTGKRPTDETFSNGLSIHTYVEIGIRDRVMEIVDPQMLQNDEIHSDETIAEYLRSILRIGINCSAMSPRERPAISDVLNEIRTIRASFPQTHESLTYNNF